MKITVKLLAVAAALLAAGCILSGTFVADVDFTASFTNGFEKVAVDLSDYTDRAADIDRIERLDCEGIIRNDLSTKDTISVYISANATYTTKAAVEGATDAYPILLDYVTKSGTPPTYDTLTVVEARAILKIPGTQWDQIKAIIKDGTFCIYFTSSGTSGASGAVTKGYLYITFTAKA